MRNIFDQYTQPENKVTHALACALEQDKRLLRSFLKNFLGLSAPNVNRLVVLEQRLPGTQAVSEEEASRKGLPDMWIHDNESWCLLVESKIAADLKNDQLLRHYNTAVSRGFSDVTVLAIDAIPQKRELPKYCRFCQWSNVYEWLEANSQKSSWAQQVARFLEIAESKFIENKYMKEGNLTKFSGIPFNADSPYNYFEAKRILGLAMSDLRKDKRLIKELCIDASAPGRGAITGRGTSIVWDLLRFKQTGTNFKNSPHLTLALEQDAIRAQVSIPNTLSGKKRKLLLSSYENFTDLIRKVTYEMESSLGDVDGYKTKFTLIQRHYPSQRSIPIIDGKIEFDMRAEFEDLAAKAKLKYQPDWLPAVYSILLNKQSNIYVGIGAEFSYHYSPGVRSAAILDHVADAWIATKPIIDLIVD